AAAPAGRRAKTRIAGLGQGSGAARLPRRGAQPMSLGELAECVGLGKPSTLRILSTLRMMGWLARDSNENYCLDREWPEISAQSWLRRLTAALPDMRKLNTDFAETVAEPRAIQAEMAKVRKPGYSCDE